MPLDNTKLHSKIEINLAKPYHQGPLLINSKLRSSKTLIDIKPIKKPAKMENRVQCNTPQEFKEVVKQVTNEIYTSNQGKFANDIKSATLDFDKLNEFNDLLNPFAKVEYRDADDVKISSKSFSTQPESKKSDSIQVKTKEVSDVKKTEQTTSNVSFSSLKPKINVAPLHSRSRTLALIDHNKIIAKKFKSKLNQFQNTDFSSSDRIDVKAFGSSSFLNGLESNQNQDFFQFKTPPKFDASDIPQFSDRNNFKSVDSYFTRVNLPELNKEIHNSNLRKNIRNVNKLKRYSVSTLFTTVIIIFCTLFLTGNAQWMGKFGEKNVQAEKNKSIKTVGYEKWIASNNLGKYSPPGDDLDKDGLNNYEEFLIGSNPTNKNSCSVGTTDNQNLLNLIDPTTCQPINFTAPGQISRFKELLNITPEFISKYQNQSIQNQSFDTPSVQVDSTIISVSTSSANMVTDILHVPNGEVDSSKAAIFIEASTKILSPKLTVQNVFIEKAPEIKAAEQVKTAEITELVKEPKVEIPAPKNSVNVFAVQQYIDQYRSYDNYDNQIQNPVSAQYFIDMSARYKVPLKYSLAMARSESRFGTDQFNQDGSDNRIGRHLNMYSIGLDDAGGSITYPSWEAGVDAFGRWYTKFENQGYSDCAKWRIYNPNGDYCQKIENLASQIENYIGN
jgi:hypothetical protein